MFTKISLYVVASGWGVRVVMLTSNFEGVEAVTSKKKRKWLDRECEGTVRFGESY